jgi:hypothetical protein
VGSGSATGGRVDDREAMEGDADRRPRRSQNTARPRLRVAEPRVDGGDLGLPSMESPA